MSAGKQLAQSTSIEPKSLNWDPSEQKLMQEIQIVVSSRNEFLAVDTKYYHTIELCQSIFTGLT